MKDKLAILIVCVFNILWNIGFFIACIIIVINKTLPLEISALIFFSVSMLSNLLGRLFYILGRSNGMI